LTYVGGNAGYHLLDRRGPKQSVEAGGAGVHLGIAVEVGQV